jgi:hypothetical protein
MIVDRRLICTYCYAVRTSETSVVNQFTRQYNPEDSSEHHTRRRENLKSHISTQDYVYHLHQELPQCQDLYDRKRHDTHTGQRTITQCQDYPRDSICQLYRIRKIHEMAAKFFRFRHVRLLYLEQTLAVSLQKPDSTF